MNGLSVSVYRGHVDNLEDTPAVGRSARREGERGTETGRKRVSTRKEGVSWPRYNLPEPVIKDGDVNHVIWFSLEYESTSGRESPSPRVKMSRAAVRVRYYHITRREL